MPKTTAAWLKPDSNEVYQILAIDDISWWPTETGKLIWCRSDDWNAQIGSVWQGTYDADGFGIFSVNTEGEADANPTD